MTQQAGENAKQALPLLDVCADPAAAIDNADAVVITTEWQSFRSLDWAGLRTSMRSPTIIDGRRMLDPSTMRRLGYRYLAVGLGEPVD